MSNFNQLYNIANAIAPYAKQEYGSSFIGFQKLKKLIKGDHLVELLMSKASTDIDKIKVIYITYFILNRTLDGKQIENILNNLYILTVDLYEEKNKIDVPCDNCDADGYVNCHYCDGDGTVDCRSCDGDGEIECYECDGKGTEDCRCCDGSGNETEEDDEGEEIEVACSCCDGKGTEECRSCGGSGSYGCPDCEGRGNQRCNECNGVGDTYCDYCTDGYTESYEEYYNVETRRIIMYGTNVQQYVGEIMTTDEYSEIEYDDDTFEYEFTLNSRYYQDEDSDYEDRRKQFGMEDDFVEIGDLVKLENYGGSLNY